MAELTKANKIFMLDTLEFIREMSIRDVDVILRTIDLIYIPSKYLSEGLAFRGLLSMIVRGIITDTIAWKYSELGGVIL